MPAVDSKKKEDESKTDWFISINCFIFNKQEQRQVLKTLTRARA